MKITASKRDEVLRRKTEYDAKKAVWDKENAKRKQRLRRDRENIYEPIKDQIESALSRFSSLRFTVRVGSSYRSDNGVRVSISCNEWGRQNDDALSWTYEASVDDGKVTNETNSWSGLRATTPAQLTSLKQTVEALEYLSSIDWNWLLNVKMPDWNDYFDKDFYNSAPEPMSFDTELKEATLEDLIGQDKAIYVKDFSASVYWNHEKVYLKILGETASQYKVVVIPKWVIDEPTYHDRLHSYIDDKDYVTRVKKSNVWPTKDDNGDYIIVDLW